MRQPRAVTDKRYEEKHKEERKAKSLVWGTSVPRQLAEEINEFLRSILDIRDLKHFNASVFNSNRSLKVM